MSRHRIVDLNWNAIFNEFRRSGLTQAEFCRRREISLYSFRKHLYRPRRAPPAPADHFLAVTILPDPAPPPRPASPALLELNPFSVYDFTPRRTRDGPERFLGGYQGYLQADAFTGYDRICAGPGVIRVACWAHVRRKFYECRTTAPVLAHDALARIRQLYRIEADCR